MDIVKRFEAFMSFDGNGKLVVTKLPGGLFSSVTDIKASFTSDPTAGSAVTILEERQAEIDFNSTVNSIAAMTVERDTRNVVVYGKNADAANNHLLFKKVAFYRQAALGELEVCRSYVEDLSQRVFYPILKCRWKTADASQLIMPLEFVEVDGRVFRVMSIKRSFNADQNDLTTSYEGEWLGGK